MATELQIQAAAKAAIAAAPGMGGFSARSIAIAALEAAEKFQKVSPVNRGAHIVFLCDRCPDGLTIARITLPAKSYLTLDAAYERIRELNWTFGSDRVEVDCAVICPTCSKRVRV